MALIDLWRTNGEGIRAKGIRNILRFAGDGELTDGGECSRQFRDLLAILSIWETRRLAEDLWTKAEDDKTPAAALALQDLVNELGNKLGYAVSRGPYRGRQGQANHDGLWTDPDGRSLVVEVKTSTAYQVRLETLAEYRRRLVADGKVAGEASLLIVVCRDEEDTQDLEWQIRGSKYSWDVRLISLKALIRLAEIKLSTDDPKSARLLRDILKPEEYTKVDRLLDLVGDVIEDVASEGEESSEAADEEARPARRPGAYVSTLDLRALRAAAVDFIKMTLGADVKEVSRTLFQSLDGRLGFYFAASKSYPKAAHDAYWFGLHDYQVEFLRRQESAHLLFWCAGAGCLFVPWKEFEPLVPGLRKTARGDRAWKHVELRWEKSGKVELVQSAGKKPVDVSKWMTPFERGS